MVILLVFFTRLKQKAMFTHTVFSCLLEKSTNAIQGVYSLNTLKFLLCKATVRLLRQRFMNTVICFSRHTFLGCWVNRLTGLHPCDSKHRDAVAIDTSTGGIVDAKRLKRHSPFCIPRSPQDDSDLSRCRGCPIHVLPFIVFFMPSAVDITSFYRHHFLSSTQTLKGR